MDFSDANFWGCLVSIIFINLILSGDNAVVIALATLNLSGKDKKRGIFWGTFGAVTLRILLTTIAAALLKVPFVQAGGGLLLIWIAIKLLKDQGCDDQHIEGSTNLFDAIKIIIFADLMMSLDNVLAVAGASGGHIGLLILGLCLSIPIVIFCSTLLSKLMNRWPSLVSLGSGLLGYTAGEMVLNDKVFHFLHEIHALEYIIPWGLAIIVVIIGNVLKKARKGALLPKVNEADHSL
ncbi:TerC family protein [Desulfitobacterium sp. AusDCA]|uniref:TerC family protein n=1 Tax=Desulfitobacterium sp. AusDCA TaxID=3240383 RepID=UPI003DA77652